MLQPGSSAASNEIETPSNRFFETIAIYLRGRGTANDVMWECLEEYLTSDKTMICFLKQIAFNTLLIRPMSLLIKQNVDSTIADFFLMQRSTEKGKGDKTGVALLPSRSILTAVEESKHMIRREDCKH